MLKYILCTPSINVFRNVKLTNNSTLNSEEASYFDTWVPTHKTA
jgi:hypothetical protein